MLPAPPVHARELYITPSASHQPDERIDTQKVLNTVTPAVHVAIAKGGQCSTDCLTVAPVVVMVKYVLDRSDVLDRAFHALSDPSRRQMIDRLAEGPASVSELAEPLPMTLAAVVQHVQVLEASGLVDSHKNGRVRTCSINQIVLSATEQWLTNRRTTWQARLDRLGLVLDDQILGERALRPTTPKRGRTT